MCKGKRENEITESYKLLKLQPQKRGKKSPKKKREQGQLIKSTTFVRW